MKSYGKIDSSWNHARFRLLLEDASKMCNELDQKLEIGQDEDGNICIMQQAKNRPRHIVACGVSPQKIYDNWKDTMSDQEIKTRLKKEFWDNVPYIQYTIDEMIPRIYDYMVNGIIEFGSLRFLSEGRIQLGDAFSTTQQLVARHSKPFILGYHAKKRICIAPTSEKSRFIDPLSYIVTKHGIWSVSDIHCTRVVAVNLYEPLAYGNKRYDHYLKQDCNLVIKLENAFEDAVKMPTRRDPHYVILDQFGNISLESGKDRRVKCAVISIKVNPSEFLDGDVLLQDKIKEMAEDTFKQFNTAMSNRDEKP